MTKFEIAFDYIIENEGKEVSTDPTDRGGVTKFGISEKFIESLKDDNFLPLFDDGLNYAAIGVLKDRNYSVKKYIAEIDVAQAKWIYQKYFWLPIYDQIYNQNIANYIFDMHVQHGKGKAAELVQRAVNATDSEQVLKIDGIFGLNTLDGINRYIYDCGLGVSWRQIKSSLIAVRESLFRCIVAHDKTQEDKLEGWLKRCYR